MTTNIDKLKGQAKEFAIACYDTNTLDELSGALRSDKADKTDMQEWSINEQEWREAITAAFWDLVKSKRTE